MIKVFIIDDHKMVVDGLMLMLKDQEKIQVVGFAYSGQEGIDKLREIDADVVLMDINMPEMNGIDTCKKLLKEQAHLKVIAVSMHKEGSLIKLMLSNGAKGYVLKNAGQDEVVEAIETVYNGKTFLDETVNDIVINSLATSSKKSAVPIPTLSRREKDVLLCILEECTTQEIADKLNIGFGTVETHRRNMMVKLGARNTAGLVRTALEYELHK